jgi:G6PDH family F420-dependent oxidoreductase
LEEESVTRLGYALSSEEHGPNDLVENASEAERRGFEFALISDHFHPWTTKQGESPFVWSTIGGIARETEDLELGTGVTAPLIRLHPAIVAQAAATAGEMMPDRFFLGVGTGESLNEHVLGDRWPEHSVRLEMLEEAVEVIRKLWTGENVSHHGEHYTVENAQVFTVPNDPPPIHVAAGGELTASAAAEFGDGLVGTSPEEGLIETFVDDAGEDAPRYGQVTVCYAEDEETAKEKAYEWWPNGALGGELGQLLPTPKHFEQAAEMLSPDDVAEAMALGPDPDEHVELIQEYADAGYDHVYVHGVGPDQSAFLEFYEEEVLPSF